MECNFGSTFVVDDVEVQNNGMSFFAAHKIDPRDSSVRSGQIR
jgi:hypothetical protein